MPKYFWCCPAQYFLLRSRMASKSIRYTSIKNERNGVRCLVIIYTFPNVSPASPCCGVAERPPLTKAQRLMRSEHAYVYHWVLFATMEHHQTVLITLTTQTRQIHYYRVYKYEMLIFFQKNVFNGDMQLNERQNASIFVIFIEPKAQKVNSFVDCRINERRNKFSCGNFNPSIVNLRILSGQFSLSRKNREKNMFFVDEQHSH